MYKLNSLGIIYTDLVLFPSIIISPCVRAIWYINFLHSDYSADSIKCFFPGTNKNNFVTRSSRQQGTKFAIDVFLLLFCFIEYAKIDS